MSLTYKGVNYDTGTNYGAGGVLSREVWRPDLAGLEIQAIRDQLHCNAIGIFGTDVDRLAQAASVASEHGLYVWLQPRLVDADPHQMLDHLADAARAAEQLRRQYPAVNINVGCELTIFSAGIIPGTSYRQRGARLSSPRSWPLLPGYNRKLNTLLARAVTVTRSHFHGQITYGAGLWERVDWRPFDVVGLNYYRVRFNRRRYAAKLRRYLRHGKPVVVVEFGCASFDGAVDKGPTAHEIIDWSGSVPQITGPYVRETGPGRPDRGANRHLRGRSHRRRVRIRIHRAEPPSFRRCPPGPGHGWLRHRQGTTRRAARLIPLGAEGRLPHRRPALRIRQPDTEPTIPTVTTIRSSTAGRPAVRPDGAPPARAGVGRSRSSDRIDSALHQWWYHRGDEKPDEVETPGDDETGIGGRTSADPGRPGRTAPPRRRRHRRQRQEVTGPPGTGSGGIFGGSDPT